MVNKHFALIDEWGQNSSAKHLSKEEWEFGGSVSGFVMCRYPWVLSKSYEEVPFFGLNYFQEQKGEQDFLIFVIFLEYRAQLKHNIVSKDNYRGNKAICLKLDCPEISSLYEISFSVWTCHFGT